jgi:membrane fusion protein, multidrug efflux system
VVAKSVRTLLLSAAALCVGACGPAAPVAAPSPGPAAPVSVIATRVRSEKVSKTFRLPAELSAFRSVAIHSKIPGFVEKIDVDRGSEVKAGQVLIRCVAPEIAAQKQEAEAMLASDEASHRRLAEAAKTPGVVASNDLEIAAKNVDAARARVRMLAEQQAYLTIAAPFDGVISERNAHEGSLVGPPGGGASVPLLRLQDQARLRLTVAVPEMAAGDVPIGRKLSFTVPSRPGEAFQGTVARSARSIEVKTRSLPVELDVDNADGRLEPGAFAEVQWILERAKPSLLVPASAIATTSERSFVILVRNGIAEWVDVRPGFAIGDRVEVFCDVKEGDWVAVRASDELRPGTKVEPKEAAPAARN